MIGPKATSGSRGATRRIAEINPSPMPSTTTRPNRRQPTIGIALGPEGNLWFTELESGQDRRDQSSRHDATSDYPIPTAEAQPAFIVRGREGNLWFTELRPTGRRDQSRDPRPERLPSAQRRDGHGGRARRRRSGSPPSRASLRINPVAHAISGFDPTKACRESRSDPKEILWLAQSTVNHRVDPVTHPRRGFGRPVPPPLPDQITLCPKATSGSPSSSPPRWRGRPDHGLIGEFATPTPSRYADGITAGPDGRIWSTEAMQQIGVIGGDTAPASIATPAVLGALRPALPESSPPPSGQASPCSSLCPACSSSTAFADS